MGLVDEGGGHVHVIRNEGSVEARTVAVPASFRQEPRGESTPKANARLPVLRSRGRQHRGNRRTT